MPTIDENRKRWTGYEWTERGHEWSGVWGGTENLWEAAIFPRIRSFVPRGRLLELAPGYGRFTKHLHRLCERLVLVDLAKNCIEACRKELAAFENVEYHVNDGKSLRGVADGSIDFLFSFDSLVHAEMDAVGGYVAELPRILAPGGVAFIHHSNIDSLRRGGELTVENLHWRGESVSADKVAAVLGSTSRVRCAAQELINWGGGPELVDCISVFSDSRSESAEGPKRVENRIFVESGVQLAAATDLFHGVSLE